MEEKDFEKYEFVDITKADTAFVAFGRDLNEMFSNSGLALSATIANIENVEQKEERHVEVGGYDLKSLMFSWLSDILFLSSSENLLFSKFDVEIEKEGEDYKLKGKCFGEIFDENKHEMNVEVKAITYHMMEIKEEDGVWKSQVIVDI